MKKVELLIIFAATFASLASAMEQNNSDPKIVERTIGIFTITPHSTASSFPQNSLSIPSQTVHYGGIQHTIPPKNICNPANLLASLADINTHHKITITKDDWGHINKSAADFYLFSTLSSFDTPNIRVALQFLNHQKCEKGLDYSDSLKTENEIKNFLDEKYQEIRKIYPIKSSSKDGYDLQPLLEELRKLQLTTYLLSIAQSCCPKLNNQWNIALQVSLNLVIAANDDLYPGIGNSTSHDLSKEFKKRAGLCTLS